MSKLLKLYSELPYPLRLLAVNIRGYFLRRWRYGSETKQLIDEILAREKWSATDWDVWQKKRLLVILERAATKVPFYREYWLKRQRNGDKSDWKELSAIDSYPVSCLRALARPVFGSFAYVAPSHRNGIIL